MKSIKHISMTYPLTLGLACLLGAACASNLQLGSGGAAAPASEPALVDCSDARFQSGNTAKSLMGWSDYQLKQAKETGEVDSSGPYCTKTISHRGDAHCQDLANSEYREALREAQEACPAP